MVERPAIRGRPGTTAAGVVPVVLAGGGGLGLWPLAREDRPRAFVAREGGSSPFQRAVRRAAGWGRPWVLVRSAHRFLAAEQLRLADVSADLLLEPQARGEGAAMLAAAVRAPGAARLLVLPSAPVHEEVARALDGLGPAGGAVRRGDRVAGVVAPAGRLVRIAQARFAPTLEAITRAVEALHRDLDFLRLDPEAWAGVPTVGAAEVLEALDPDWIDLPGPGPASPSAAHRGDVVAVDATGCRVDAEHGTVALLGVRDLEVRATRDAVLVAHRDASHRVPEVVARLRRDGRGELLQHPRTLRPWGAFERLAEGPRWLAKRIVVAPGQALSLQRHQHRAEHWVVVRGRARVTCGDAVVELRVDQSTYIPRGVAHRLENPGDEPLVVLEVQTGAVLDEADIERLEDRYGRGG